MPGMPQDVAYCRVDGYNNRAMLEEEEATALFLVLLEFKKRMTIV
ncbi:hypothetical protein [Evansella halocellulosilytica]|nr:hypothetical protein [Evansella halocellulosilytica]